MILNKSLEWRTYRLLLIMSIRSDSNSPSHDALSINGSQILRLKDRKFSCFHSATMRVSFCKDLES